MVWSNKNFNKGKIMTPKMVATNRNLIGRIILASVGGYVLVNLISIVFSRISPQPINESILTASLLSFSIYIVIILWTFTDSNIKRICVIQFGLILGLTAFTVANS